MKYEFNGTTYNLPDASPNNLVPASIKPHRLPGHWVVSYLHTVTGYTGHATTVITTDKVVEVLEAAKRDATGQPAPEHETLMERRIRESQERGER